jgi:hypothetical protein
VDFGAHRRSARRSGLERLGRIPRMKEQREQPSESSSSSRISTRRGFGRGRSTWGPGAPGWSGTP